MTTATATTTQVYQVFIRATPEQVWQALVDPEWTQKYFYGTRAEYDLRPGGRFRSVGGESGEQMVEGEVLEVDPPRKLVQTWRMVMDEAMAAEGFTRLTYEIAETRGGVSRLTVTHELENAPRLSVVVGGGLEDTGAGGGWAWVLSDLKSLLENGAPMNMEDGFKE